MGAIFSLYLRQLSGKWHLSLVLLLTSLPAIMTLVVRLVGAEIPEEFPEVMLDGMFVEAILPIVTMTLATAAFGNEVEDRTLSYLVLKPLPRLYIAFPKMMAAVAGPLMVVSGVVVVVLALYGRVGTSLAVVAGLFAGVAAYSAIFTWAGLVARYALGFALVYVFLWEGVVARFAPGVNYLSVRSYALAIMYGIDKSGLTAFEESAIELPAAVGGAVVVTIGFLWLTVRHLQRMDVP